VVCSCVARPAPTSTLSPYTTLFRSNRNSIRVYPAIPVEFQSLIGRAQTGELLHHVNGGFPGFQSLIGRAQTADGTPSSRLVTSFQSLIGRAQTPLGHHWVRDPGGVSIPHR